MYDKEISPGAVFSKSAGMLSQVSAFSCVRYSLNQVKQFIISLVIIKKIIIMNT